MKHTAALVISVVLAVAGCNQANTEGSAGPAAIEPMAKADEPATRPSRVAGLPDGWELAPKAQYTATQAGELVTIKAIGENPTAGHQTKLFPSLLKIWPPQYVLGRKAPEGMAAQVITPFDATTSFNSDRPVTQVVVTDAAGRHEVPVKQSNN